MAAKHDGAAVQLTGHEGAAVGRELPFTFLVVWASEFSRTDRRLSAICGHTANLKIAI